MADDDAVDVAAEDGVVPDAGVASPKRDVAHHDGGFDDVNARADRGRFAQERIELFFELAHE